MNETERIVDELFERNDKVIFEILHRIAELALRSYGETENEGPR